MKTLVGALIGTLVFLICGVVVVSISVQRHSFDAIFARHGEPVTSRISVAAAGVDCGLPTTAATGGQQGYDVSRCSDDPTAVIYNHTFLTDNGTISGHLLAAATITKAVEKYCDRYLIEQVFDGSHWQQACINPPVGHRHWWAP